MMRRRAIFTERCFVNFSAIAKIAVKREGVETRITTVQFDHQPVTGDFGDDAGGGNTRRQSVAVHQRKLFSVSDKRRREAQVVNKQMVGRVLESVDGTLHGMMVSPRQAVLVNVRDLDHADAVVALLFYKTGEEFAALGREYF